MSEGYWRNRTYVVTGGARGQGAAEVNRLLELGSHVVIIDPLPSDSPDWSVDRAHERLKIITGGIDRESTWVETLALVKAMGQPLAGLVNNAGISLRKTVTDTTLEQWERVMGVNLTGAFLGIRALAPSMIDGGSIVNVSSTTGLTGYFSAAYTTSKWGLRGLSRAAAIELAARKITVNVVCPGQINTPIANRAGGGYDTETARLFFEANRAATPLSRAGEPDEIAGAVIFLLGPDSRYITATDLAVDGGMFGGGMYCQMGRLVGTVAAVAE